MLLWDVSSEADCIQTIYASVLINQGNQEWSHQELCASKFVFLFFPLKFVDEKLS